MAKEFPTELLNKYYARGVELCDARFWCGMCEKHANMRKSYKMYIEEKLDELKLLLDFDNMLYEEV